MAKTDGSGKPAMVRDEKTGLEMVEATKLVPCLIRVSEAGFGLRAGEVRGLAPDVADAMIKKGSAEAIFSASK